MTYIAKVASKFLYITVGASIIFLSYTNLVLAECGNVIFDTENFSPIENCENPFNADETVSFTYAVNFEDFSLTNNSEYLLDPATTTISGHFSYTNLNDFGWESLIFYKKSGQDYVRSMGTGPGDFTWETEAGDYVAIVTYEEAPMSTFDNLKWWQKIIDWFAPSALAIYEDYVQVQQINFSIKQAPVEVMGASSVLFLPGVQASRLYESESGNENQLWEPNRDNDVARLEMTEGGQSINDIYTRDVLDEIYGVSNVYQSFLDMLSEMEEGGVIADSSAFAYDWRYGVKDVAVNGTRYQDGVRSLAEEIEKLAESSYTGKVTIIGHSNGGLVAKELISELERQGKDDLVDKVVFLGVPQLGSAKAIGVMLHGLGQLKGAGLIVNNITARDVIRNMPGVYTLLPSQRYFAESNEALITSDDSNVTASIRAYGDIDSLEKLTNFVLDTQNVRADQASINQPSTLNTNLMQAMVIQRDELDNWVAPSGVEVYEVAGTGSPTIKSFEYKSFPCLSFSCGFNEYMKAYPKFTNEGDETVTNISAEAYQGEKVRAVVDLRREGGQFDVKSREHSDLTESPTVQKYLDSIIRYPYLNETLEIPSEFITVARHYTIIGSHSPVEISLVDDKGQFVGRQDDTIVEGVSGSQYFELGGSSYIVVPTETNYTLSIKGQDVGVYSLTIDSLNEEDVQKNEYEYIGASSTPQMIASFQASSTGFSTIKTDIDGDGDIDLEQTLDGDLVEVPVYTYPILIKAINDLKLNKILTATLLLQAKAAQKYDANPSKLNKKLELLALATLEETLRYYERKKIITSSQFKTIQTIINNLRK